MNTILLVEDDLDTQEMMKSMLQRDYRLVCAIDTRQTLEALELRRVDLILMDLSLHRNECGLTLTRYLREQETYRDIPIIALTAHAFSSDKHKCLEAGCNDYLTKPFRVNELRELIYRFAKPNGTTVSKGDARPAQALS